MSSPTKAMAGNFVESDGQLRTQILSNIVIAEAVIGLGALITWGGSYVRFHLSEGIGIEALSLWSICAGAFCFVVAACAARGLPIMGAFNRRGDWAVFVVLMVSSASIAIAGPQLPSSAVYALTCLASVGELWLFLRWASVLNRTSAFHIALVFFLAYAIRFTIGLALQELSLITGTVLQMCLLATSVFLLAHASATIRSVPNLFEREEGSRAPLPLEAHTMAIIVALIVLDGFFSGVFETLYAPLPTGYNSTVSIMRLMVTLVLVGALFVFRDIMTNPLSLIVIIAICVCVPFGPLLFLHAIPAEISHAVAMIMSYMLRSLVAIFLITLAHESRRSTFVICGVGWGCERLFLGIGTYFGTTDFFHGNHVMLASILTYLVLFVCLVSVMALYNRNLKRQSEVAKVPEGDRPEDELESAKKRIVGEFDLTERESEIMLLTCKGYSKRKIAETLFISENTVREYSRRLYGKLDIHSKEELIDIFEGCFEARR